MGAGFSHNGKTLLSAVDPAGRADRVAGKVAVKDRTLYLCPSPLFGYGLERLLSRLADAPNSALLCVEADPEMFALSREHFSPALKSNPRLRLTSQRDAAALCALLRREWGPRFFRRVETVRLSGGWQLFPALYDSLAQSLQREIAIDWGNAMTLARLGRRYIRNALRNLALIPRCPSLGQLSFGEDPILVLGAGPSLDSLLDALPARFGKAHRLPETRPFRIACVDTCLPALRERGITPDLVVVLESQHWNLDDFIGMSGWKVPAAFDLSALPRSGAVLAGGVSLFFTPWARLAIFQRLGSAGLLPEAVPPLGSVGLSAVSIARRLTRGAIITAGLDFAFTLDSYHARSTGGHLGRLRRQNRFAGLLNPRAAFDGTVLAASKTGGKAITNPALRNYRDLFQREFAADPRIFDLAAGGLPLGIPSLSPEEAFGVLRGVGNGEWGMGNGGWGTGNGEWGSGETRKARCQTVPVDKGNIAAALAEKLRVFAQGEQGRLILLCDILTGKAPMDHAALDTLVGECDYLWAHFPDYAAAGRRPGRAEMEAGSPQAVSFLKRLRIEIDPFLELWDFTLRELSPR
ncbi:MAG: DUF115 domain-containing protein [Treponema sp.]|jgi:hypothetical protein|nr:DUF115 domain-containing protein [Treponema sp.]